MASGSRFCIMTSPACAPILFESHHTLLPMLRSLRSGILVFLAFAAAVWLLQQSGRIPSFTNPFAAKPITIDRTPILIKNIRSIAQLMTIEYYDEVVVDSIHNSGKLIPLPPFVFPFKASLVLIVKGRLLAGLDLQKLDSSHFIGNKDSIAIQLPRAKVLEVIVNPTDIETFSEEGKWTQAAVTALTTKARTKILHNAYNQGVLFRANEKARSLVEQLMINAGYKKVVITTQ